jgi:hypothetical protein
VQYDWKYEFEGLQKYSVCRCLVTSYELQVDRNQTLANTSTYHYTHIGLEYMYPALYDRALYRLVRRYLDVGHHLNMQRTSKVCAPP